MTNEIKEILANVKSKEYIDLDYEESKLLLDYITNLQEENENKDNKILELRQELLNKKLNVKDIEYKEKMIYKSRNKKAIEYVTSYEAISTIQGLDKIEQNKKLDERTMNVMVERYLKVHHNLLNILEGDDKE